MIPGVLLAILLPATGLAQAHRIVIGNVSSGDISVYSITGQQLGSFGNFRHRGYAASAGQTSREENSASGRGTRG